MRITITSLAIAVTWLSLAFTAQAQDGLTGVWKVEELTTEGGQNPGTSTDLAPSLYVFTDGYYTNMWIPGDGDRPEAGLQDVSDEDTIAAYNSFFAQSGSYEVSGSTITFHVMLAKVPAATGGMPEMEYRLEGDTLYLTQPANPLGVMVHRKLVRLE